MAMYVLSCQKELMIKILLDSKSAASYETKDGLKWGFLYSNDSGSTTVELFNGDFWILNFDWCV